MSQRQNVGAPTPRRSGRISNKAISVDGASGVTQLTNAGATPARRPNPRTKVNARKSNAYGASGRVGTAEQMSVTTTGFSQAFETQRVDTETLNSQPVNTTAPESQPVADRGVRAGTYESLTSIDEVEMRDADSSEAGDFLMSGGRNGLPKNGIRTQGFDGTVSLSNILEDGMVMSKDPDRNTTDWSYSAAVTSSISRPLKPRPANSVQARIQTSYTTPVQERPERITTLRQPKQQIVYQHDASSEEEDEAATATQPQASQAPPQQSWDERLGDKFEEWGYRVAAYREARGGQIFDWAWWKMFGRRALYTAIILFILFWPVSIQPSQHSSGAEPSTLRMGPAVASRLRHTWRDIADYIQPAPPLTYNENKADFEPGTLNALWGRMEKLNRYYLGIFNNHTQQHSDMRATLNEFRQQLPDVMIVELKHGRVEIADEFWHALVRKASSSEEDPTWQNYLKQTRSKLNALIDSSEKAPPEDQSRPQPMGRDEFVAKMAQQYQSMSTLVEKQIKEALRIHGDKIKGLVQAEARKSAMASLRLQSLAQTNLLANYELHLKKVNYFGTGLGAYVDATYTSTTYTNAPNIWVDYFYKSAALRRNPPAIALVKWEEPGDCWCSSPTENKDGQLQLAVTLEHPIFPKQVTIEHVPMAMVPRRNIASAPRDVEIWVQTDGAITSTYSDDPPDCYPLPKGYEVWRCMGRFRYDIHGSNHVQTFDINSVAEHPVKNTLIRVANNWGAAHSCIYRVRLHGDDARPDVEYTVQTHDNMKR